jgi:hypothetical protein
MPSSTMWKRCSAGHRCVVRSSPRVVEIPSAVTTTSIELFARPTDNRYRGNRISFLREVYSTPAVTTTMRKVESSGDA